MANDKKRYLAKGKIKTGKDTVCLPGQICLLSDTDAASLAAFVAPAPEEKEEKKNNKKSEE